MKKRRWLIGTGLVAAVLGGSLLWISTSYQPLLWVVDQQAVRTDDWNELKPIVFNGMPSYSKQEELQMMEQRSKEEFVLAVAKDHQIQADEALVEKQLLQIGATPAEREKVYKETGTTEEIVKNNYRRAMIAFQLKSKMTAEIDVTDQEVADFYEQHKQEYAAPEFRSLHYFKLKNTDTMLIDLLKQSTPDEFKNVVQKYTTTDPNNRYGGFAELTDIQNLLSSLQSERAAVAAFQAEADQLTGPVEEGNFLYWFLVEEIKPPKQFTLEESRNKIYTTLKQEKQLAHYRGWLDGQRESYGYRYYPENLDRSRLQAFWHDLSDNFSLLSGK